MKITYKLLCELADVAGFEISEPMPRMYNIYKRGGVLFFTGTARECYAYLRGWQQKKITDGEDRKNTEQGQGIAEFAAIIAVITFALYIIGSAAQTFALHIIP